MLHPVLEQQKIDVLIDFITSGRPARRWQVGGLCMAPDTGVPADAPAEIPTDVVAEEAPPLIEDCSAQGLSDCGGACIDIFSDSFNCGGCGIICADGQGCSGGACV